MKITVLGAGLVGLPLAADLQKNRDHSIKVYDISPSRVEKAREQFGLKAFVADVSDPIALAAAVSDAALVVNAVPGSLGFATLRSIIAAGKHAVDIAFSPEDPMELDTLARKKGVTVITDMGVAPGMSNMLCGYAHSRLDRTDRVRIFVGGLPQVRQLPFEYKAVFSPADVIEEYTRPARFIRNGTLVEMPALSEPELLDFNGIGTLEAFNSDGLRTLINTIECPDMVEKTLRYPGHVEKVRFLRECGFFSSEKVEVGGQWIRPVDIAKRILFPLWDLGEEKDLTVMKVTVEGLKDGKPACFEWFLFDTYDSASGVHSMARTTGYAATAAVGLITGGLFSQAGVFPPEVAGRDQRCLSFVLNHLRDRNVIYQEHHKPS
jgi:saccharopine dehydrogenase-like NADP-dependent oxidoreductase